MKILFFIAARQISKYSYRKIIDREKYRFVAILSENDTAKKKEISNFFDKIHFVENKEDNPFSELNYEQTEQIISKEIANLNNPDISIICADEANVVLAGRLREKFNAQRGARKKSLLPFKNKFLMREKFKNSNIRCPGHYLLDHKNIPLYDELITHLGRKIIIKPTEAFGSAGVSLIESNDDYQIFLKKANTESIQYIAEEFVEGELFTIDHVVKSKQSLFRECTSLSCPNLDFQSGENICGIPLLHNDPLYQRLVDFSERCLETLDAPDGAYHMECFLTKNDEIVFLEVGAREPGLLIVDSYSMMFGVNVLDINLSLQSGITFMKTPSKTHPCFWGTFPKQEGVIQELIEPNIKSQYIVHWKAKVGEFTTAATSNLDDIGYILVWNPDYDALMKDYLVVCQHVASKYH